MNQMASDFRVTARRCEVCGGVHDTQAEYEHFGDLHAKRISFEDGFTAELWGKHTGIAVLVAGMAQLMRDAGADNYLATTLKAADAFDVYEVIITKKGAKTPSDVAEERRQHILRLEDELRDAEAYLLHIVDCRECQERLDADTVCDECLPLLEAWASRRTSRIEAAA